MDSLVEIAFKGKRREFFRWSGGADDPLSAGSAVLVEADRGEDLGVVHSTGELANLRSHRLPNGTHGALPDRKVLRRATDEESSESRRLHEQDDEAARTRSRELVQQHGLVMKVTDAEWQFDRRKLTLYFTAEKRVDFRALVRDLAAAFRARIELKQIGVRDEARRLSGIGRCGREYCSSSWLPELLPVNLGIAKDQRLSLNPTQISGACGRLMCCLRYEHDFYVQSRKRFPKEGRILTTTVGEEKVLSNDIFRETVTLRSAEGDTRVVPLHSLKGELAGLSGGTLESEEGEGGRQLAAGRHGEAGVRQARVLTVRAAPPTQERQVSTQPAAKRPGERQGNSHPVPEQPGERQTNARPTEEHSVGPQPTAQPRAEERDEERQPTSQTLAKQPTPQDPVPTDRPGPEPDVSSAQGPGEPEGKSTSSELDTEDGAGASDAPEPAVTGPETPTSRKRRRRGRRGGRHSKGTRDGDDSGENAPDAGHNQDND